MKRVGKTSLAGTTDLMVAILATISLAAVVAGCGDDKSDSRSGGKDMRSVTLVSAAPAQVRLYPFFVADELGFFEEEGLDVSIESVEGSALALQQLVAGRADFAYASSEGTIPAFAEHPEKVAAFYDVFTTGIFHLYSLDGGNVDDAEDLRGGTIGVDGLDTGEAIFARAAAANAGLDSQDDIDLLPVTGQAVAQVQALRDGRIDAMAAPSDFRVAARVQGIDLTCITCGELEVASSAIAVSPEVLEDDRDVVVGLGRALARATLFGEANPDAALEIMREVAPEDFVDPEFAEAILAESIEDMRPADETQYGAVDVGAWEQQLAILEMPEAGGEVLGESVDLDGLLIDDLANEINDFDANETRQAGNAE